MSVNSSSACVEPRMPIFRTVPTTRKPGMSGRTMNAVGRCVGLPSLPAVGVCAKTVMTPALVREADPVLAPRDAPRAVRVLLGAGDDVLRVGARLGLGEGVRRERLAACEGGEVARLLLVGAEEHERLAAEPRVHADHDAERRVHRRDRAEDARVAGAGEARARRTRAGR